MSQHAHYYSKQIQHVLSKDPSHPYAVKHNSKALVQWYDGTAQIVCQFEGDKLNLKQLYTKAISLKTAKRKIKILNLYHLLFYLASHTCIPNYQKGAVLCQPR